MVNKKQRRQAGFTMIELIMVIVILGILSAVAAPKFLDISGDARAAATDSMHGAFQSAFNMAFAAHRAAGLTADSGTGDTQYVTDCDSAKNYLDGGAWPNNVSCDTGVITYPDARTSTITAEDADSAAQLSSI
ncbi:MAG: type II secretion system protein [Magnetococcales bacterium]|nr:type II secretion system protein [Magnetococcales bacterium]